MHDSERNFILSLTDVDDPEGAASCLPLLGSDPRPERFGPLAGPYSADSEADAASSCVVPLGPKKTLVLDLDETLVASTRKPVPSDFKVGDDSWYGSEGRLWIFPEGMNARVFPPSRPPRRQDAELDPLGIHPSQVQYRETGRAGS